MHATATITARGQLTLPRPVRNILNTRTVEFEITDGNTVLLRPVESVAGSLSGYAKRYRPVNSVREQVWKEVASEKTRRTSA